MNFLHVNKSYISVFLAFILVAVSFSFVSVKAENTSYQDASEAYSFLKGTQVISDDETFVPEEEITRAHFIKLAVSLSGISIDTESVSGNIFTDVTAKTQYASWIEAANKLGYVHGSNGKFNPDGKISFAEAVKIVVHILGYEDYAAVYGGYPVGYLTVSNRLNLSDGIGIYNSDSMTYADAMILLKNAANTEVMQFEGIKGDDFSLNTVEGETLLFKNHGIACIEGVVEANGYTNLFYSESELVPGQILVNGMIFDDSDFTMQDTIGLNVRLFYDYSSDKTVKDAKYAQILDDNTIIKVDSEELTISDGKLEYYEDELTKKILSFSPVVTCITNGKMTSFNAEDLLSVEKGSIEFISNNSDKIIDIVKIEKYSTLVVNAVSETTGVIITKDGSRIELEPDSQAYSFEIEKNGKKASLSQIKPGDVILLAEGEGVGYYHISILASDKKLTAAFDEIGDGYGVIGGEKYDIDSSVAESIKVATTYEISLDALSNVSFVSVENDMVYGFLYGVAKQGLGDPQCRIFTENDRWVTLDFADKVKFNGSTVSAENLYDTLTAMGEDYKKLIRYNVNNDAELIKLETYQEIPIGDDDESYAEKNDTFRLSFSGNATYRFTPKSFNGRFFVDSNTKVFAIPSDLSEDGFRVRTISSLNSDNSYAVNAFNVNEYLYTNVITTSELAVDSDVSYTDRFMVVKNIGSILNKNGEVAPSLRGYRRGSEVAFPVDTSENGVDAAEFNSLSTGDVIHFKYDEDNNVVAIKKYPVEDVFYTSANHYSSSVVIGAIAKNIDVAGKRLRLIYTENGDELGITYTSTTTAALWDVATQTYKEVEVSEILPGDIIFANTRYHVCYDILIIRN